MPKVYSENGRFPKRIGDCVIYRLDEDIILRKKSGFTTKGNLTSSKYKLTRMNAHEFGNVSRLCKCIRVALKGVLPKRNNLVVVNALTKKMRAIMTLDKVSSRGERNLATAFRSRDAKDAMIDYVFNSDASFEMDYKWLEDELSVFTASVIFSKKNSRLGFRIHLLGFDFKDESSELVSSDWRFYSKKSLPKEIVFEKQSLNKSFEISFAILEIASFELNDGTYVPLIDDKGKLVQIVGVF